ncbi:Putative Gamma-glutamyltransferase [Rhizopus microsporus]|nr:Putative Gamma-glutamyltransferase [Rhizopus microsporus]
MVAVDEESQPFMGQNERKIRRNRLFIFTASVIMLMFISATASLPFKRIAIDIYSENHTEPHLVVGHQGAVAVELKECSDAGLDILKDGGGAVDAAIASALCIGVVNSFATGIGGGGFMLIRSPNGTFEFIDFRESAPAASHKDMFVNDPMAAQRGGLAVGVPGEIRGFQLAHERYGKLPWKDLFASAIKVAEEGFEKSKLWIEKEPGFAEVYAPTGVIAKPGDIIKRTKLAQTLKVIAEEGADVFYEGIIAQTIVNATQAAGGILTMEDMRNYKPLIRPTISTSYHGKKVVTCSAPTSGPALLSVLNIIEAYNFQKDGPTALNIHRLVEALKFGYAFRTELGDPDFIHNQKRIEEIISKDWAEYDKTFEPLYYHPKFDTKDPHGTMHLSVIDKEDGAVSLTSTVNLMFGAKFMDPVTGIILNDEMDDFSIPGIPNNFGLYPSVYNYAAPGKRPLSTITPTIIEGENNKLEMAVGGSGGSQIMTATLNVILNTYDFGDNVFDAVSAPRIHHQLFPNVVGFETGYDVNILNQLEKIGHTLQNLAETGTVSASQAIRKFSNGTLHAASDPRKKGVAAAY